VAECIFCMIAAGQVPAKIVYETPTVVAFDDLSPQAPVHTLIIPRSHYTDLGDGVPDQVRAALLAAVPEVARSRAWPKAGTDWSSTTVQTRCSPSSICTCMSWAGKPCRTAWCTSPMRSRGHHAACRYRHR